MVNDPIMRREIEEALRTATDDNRKAAIMLQLFCDHDFNVVATGQVCIDECTKCGYSFAY